MIKKPAVSKSYKYKTIYNNATDFHYFDFDTTDMTNGPYYLALASSTKPYKEKWEFELPNRNLGRKAGLRKLVI